LRRYLQQDYEDHHGSFNYDSSRGAHNHTAFHLLVEWALGGTPELLEAIWKQHEDNERDAFASPAAITTDNVFDHLGNGKYYQAYLYFFSDIALKTPINDVLEEWIFSPKANLDGKQPQMLNRLLDGILHPLLYLGYGIEFSLPGLIAEGLTHVSVHGAPSSTLLPKSMFGAQTKRGPGTHAFSIVSRILKDSAFKNYVGSFDNLQVNLGQKIQSYAAEWLVDGANPAEIAKKVQELTFLNVMIYAVGGWRDTTSGGEFHLAEFTLLHLLTSSMTLTSYMAVISSPTSKSLLLRAYFTRSVALYISRGRPELPIRSFFAAPILTDFPGPAVKPTALAFPDPRSPFAETPNLWLKIIQSALVHPDDHLSKVQRTLAHYGSLYGHIAAGEYKGTELKDSELVDGTLFVRTAALTMEWMGRIREGEPARFWGDDPNYPEARIF
jgi:hypothetical protein